MQWKHPKANTRRLCVRLPRDFRLHRDRSLHDVAGCHVSPRYQVNADARDCWMAWRRLSR